MPYPFEPPGRRTSAADVVAADAQGDVCRCPLCTTSFVSSGSHRPDVPPQRALFSPGPFVPGRRLMSDKLCLVHCGDACDCGQGPEGADLDPVDVAAMRAVEGRG